MNIVIALNRIYFRYTFVLIDSILRTHHKTKIHFYLLNKDLTEEQIAELQEYAAPFCSVVTDVKIGKEMFPEDLPLPDEQVTIETYFRLAMADVLPEEVERVLYIDADTVVIGDLTEMYEQDFDGAYLLACKEEHAAFEDSRSALFNERLKNGYTYFNAGVLLIDLKALRDNGYNLRRYLELIQPIKQHIAFADQDLLNYVHADDVRYLDEDHYVDSNRYNMFARYAWNRRKDYEQVKKEACIVHYSGYKPWNGNGLRYDSEYIWWEYAKHTPYYVELMEEYVKKTIMDPTIPSSFINLLNENGRLSNIDRQLTAQNEKLKADLNESMAINQELMRILQAGTNG